MFDAYVFKKLAHNDTGQARGHQGGIVIPKDIAQFFPPLPKTITADNPTVDRIVTADLFVDGQRVQTVKTRFQHQTWGGTRSPERRLTENLGPLRNEASKDDILLFTKNLEDDDHIQLHLIRKGTIKYHAVNEKIDTSRWGPVDPNDPPVSRSQIYEAEEFVETEATEPPKAFEKGRQTIATTTIRKARNRAFRSKLLEQYDYRCTFTGRKFLSPIGNMILGLDAAHVVPVNELGSDHPANGLLLTKDLHWAFDRGLVGINENRTIYVPKKVRKIVGNEFLRDLHGHQIREAREPNLRIMEEALDWHKRNRLIS